MALGENIRFHRERLNLTLEQLSEKSGVDVGTISALENRNSGRSKYAPALCKALGFTVEQLADDSFDWKSVAPTKRWPFPEIDEDKLFNLPEKDVTRIETALMILAANFGIDIKVDKPKANKAPQPKERSEAA